MLRFRQQIDMDYKNERVKRHTANDWAWTTKDGEREKVSEWCLSMCMFARIQMLMVVVQRKKNNGSYKANGKFSFNIYSIHLVCSIVVAPLLCDPLQIVIPIICTVYTQFSFFPSFEYGSLRSAPRGFFKLLINANWFRISTIDNCHRCQNTL